MTVYLLDSNIAIKTMKDREPILAQRLIDAVEHDGELVLSVITRHEIELGVLRNSNRETARLKRDRFLALISATWPLDADDAIRAAEIRATLMAAGNTIGAYDLLIAAQGLQRNAVVVTNNLRKFSRVAGLRCEDWTQPA